MHILCYFVSMGEKAGEKLNAGITASRWRGFHWPLVSFLSGLLVYYLLFKTLVDPLNPQIEALNSFSYQFLWEGEAPASRITVVSADLNARYKHAIPSVLMAFSFLAALVVAFGFILPRFGRGALACGAAALPAGAFIGFTEQYNNAIRMAVADCPPGGTMDFCPLDQAVIRGLPGSSFTMETLSQIRFLTDFNSIISVAAIFLLGFCFFFLARSAGPQGLDPAHLLIRRRSLEAALVIAGLVLVFSVATTHGFYHLASSFMQPTFGVPLGQLASAGSTYWGAVYTTVLIVVALPATISIARDSQLGSEAALPDGSFKERREWREQHGLGIGLKDMLAGVAASFAPILTAPSLDLIQAVLGAN